MLCTILSFSGLLKGDNIRQDIDLLILSLRYANITIVVNYFSQRNGFLGLSDLLSQCLLACIESPASMTIVTIFLDRTLVMIRPEPSDTLIFISQLTMRDHS